MTIVLAAVDATEAARGVLATATAIGEVMEAYTQALHVGDDPGVAEKYAHEFGVPMTVVLGEPADEIVRMGERADVALVVLGLHGVAGQHGPGHTARVVATRLSKLVLVVPPDVPAHRPPLRVLFPLDGIHGVSDAMRPLIAAFVAAGFDVIAVHVFDRRTVPMFLDGAADEEVWREEFLAEHCAELGIRLETRPGPTVASLLEVAAAEDVDVIALGWRQDLSPRRAAVVREVLASADRPVALVPLTT